MGIVTLILFLIMIPGIIGLAGAKFISIKTSTAWMAALPIGFFIEISIFQMLAFPWSLLNLSFGLLCVVFIVVLLTCTVLSIIYFKNKGLPRLSIPTLCDWDIIYGIIAVGLISWQVYNMIYLDIGYWSSDDATYGAMANDAITYDTLFHNDAFTGVAGVLYIQRAMQTFVVYPAFLSYISSFPVATVNHTILGVYYLLLAYSVYAFLGKIIFGKIENILIFLIVLSILYIFGLYSIYSQTYRLLGPSTQGKAVLAVSFFPLIFSLLITKLEEDYNHKFGIVLLLLSFATASMTLFGTITMIGNITVPIIFSLFKKERKWGNLRYVLWGAVCPAIYCCIYFYSRFYP